MHVWHVTSDNSLATISRWIWVNIKAVHWHAHGTNVPQQTDRHLFNSLKAVKALKAVRMHTTSRKSWIRGAGNGMPLLISKLNKRLYFLKQLKRAGMSTGDLLCFYKSVIRPVAEYACPAWHSSLTVKQSNRIESFQKHALKIIYNDFTSGDNAYSYNLLYTCWLATTCR